jgi:hypothetical protein
LIFFIIEGNFYKLVFELPTYLYSWFGALKGKISILGTTLFGVFKRVVHLPATTPLTFGLLLLNLNV